MTGFPPNPVILVTPVITADGLRRPAVIPVTPVITASGLRRPAVIPVTPVITTDGLRRPAVILVTPAITAEGCDGWGDGNPEERSQPPVGHLIKMRALWIQPRSATGVGVGRVNGAEASGFDADGKKIQAGFPSKLENDGAGRRRPRQKEQGRSAVRIKRRRSG